MFVFVLFFFVVVFVFVFVTIINMIKHLSFLNLKCSTSVNMKNIELQVIRNKTIKIIGEATNNAFLCDFSLHK